MKKFEHINEILDFAMNAEQKAIDLYTRLAEQAKTDDMQQVFMQFAKEEMGHKARIMRIRDEGIFEVAKEKIADLKIAEYTGPVTPHEHMDYQEALVLAMNMEKAAFKLYSDLADTAPNQELAGLFRNLAQEEARHKLRFELEYDEYVLRDN